LISRECVTAEMLISLNKLKDAFSTWKMVKR